MWPNLSWFQNCVNPQSKWTILSGDIPFVNRFFLMETFPCTSVEGDSVETEHPVDICLDITMDDVSGSDPFLPFKIFSFDLETSIAHDTISVQQQ